MPLKVVLAADSDNWGQWGHEQRRGSWGDGEVRGNNYAVPWLIDIFFLWGGAGWVNVLLSSLLTSSGAPFSPVSRQLPSWPCHHRAEPRADYLHMPLLRTTSSRPSSLPSHGSLRYYFIAPVVDRYDRLGRDKLSGKQLHDVDVAEPWHRNLTVLPHTHNPELPQPHGSHAT